MSKNYYKIKDNSCDEWEIVITDIKSEDTFNNFRECKAELINIFCAVIEFETKSLKLLRKLKKQDIK